MGITIFIHPRKHDTFLVRKTRVKLHLKASWTLSLLLNIVITAHQNGKLAKTYTIGYICTACSRHTLQWGKPVGYPATSAGWRCFTAKFTILKSHPPSDFHHCEHLTSNCEFSNFRSGPAHVSVLLRCDTLSLGDRCPTFRDSLQVSSLTLKKSRLLSRNVEQQSLLDVTQHS